MQRMLFVCPNGHRLIVDHPAWMAPDMQLHTQCTVCGELLTNSVVDQP